MAPKKVFIAATHQNVGKTMLSLGLLGNLKQRGLSIGYIKPIGQRTVALDDGISVDEDALLMERVYDTQANLQDMNPVRVGKGFTAKYIQHGRTNTLEHQILNAYERVSAQRDFVVIEGTGHAGVGSVLDLSNARVAQLLQAPVIMVAPGGVGRPIDEVALNHALLREAGATLAGVVINKVQIQKYESVKELVVKGFERMGIRVLGVLPYDDILSEPTVGEVMQEINAKLINVNLDANSLETPVQNNLVGAMSAHQALEYFKPGSLIITPGDREDIILAAIGRALSEEVSEPNMVAGIVLTGQTMPHAAILELIHRSRIPVMVCVKDTYTVASQIHDLMVKICPNEISKIQHATDLVTKYMDLDAICASAF